MGKLCLRGDSRVCGQSAQCAFQAKGLNDVGQRLAPMGKANANLEKGENYPQFFLGVNFLWRNTVHHGGDPGGLAQLSKRKFSTSCNAKTVAARESSMQLLYSDANGYRQAAEAIGHTASCAPVKQFVPTTTVMTYYTASSSATPRRQTSDSPCHSVHFLTSPHLRRALRKQFLHLHFWTLSSPCRALSHASLPIFFTSALSVP